jgi:hypothetical protein
MLLPCSHVIAVITAVKADLMDWILPMYIIAGLVTAYTHIELYPVVTTDLDVDESVKIPEIQKARGRIAKKQKERGSKKDADFQGQQRCGKCKKRSAPGERNHNRRTCMRGLIDLFSNSV